MAGHPDRVGERQNALVASLCRLVQIPERRALTRYLELAEHDQQRLRAARQLQELGQQLHWYLFFP